MKRTEVAIIENGGANIASLRFALERLNATSVLTADAERIRAAPFVILPGVGAAGDAMQRLRRSGLDRVIPNLRQPVLGICLGMQLLFDASEEGDAACLGIMRGAARRLRPAPGRPIPHMGWNTLQPSAATPLLAGLAASAAYAYFVHSFAVPLVAATTVSCTYGEAFSACVEQANFHGVQFHPERSAGVGARILENFLALKPKCD